MVKRIQALIQLIILIQLHKVVQLIIIPNSKLM